MGFINYWWMVASKAFRATNETLISTSLRSPLSTIVIVAATFGLTFWLAGSAEAIDSAQQTAVSIAAVVVLYPAFFVFNFICAPALIDEERRAKIAKIETDLVGFRRTAVSFVVDPVSGLARGDVRLKISNQGAPANFSASIKFYGVPQADWGGLQSEYRVAWANSTQDPRLLRGQSAEIAIAAPLGPDQIQILTRDVLGNVGTWQLPFSATLPGPTFEIELSVFSEPESADAPFIGRYRIARALLPSGTAQPPGGVLTISPIDLAE